MHRLRRLGLAALLLGLLPATAAGSIYSRVLHTYQGHGAIPPCLYTGAELSSALKGVDVYGQQYFSDFTNAIQAALTQRAGGACLPGGTPAAAAPFPVAGGGLRLPSVTAATGAGVPLPLLAIAVLVLAGLAVAGGSALRRALGFQPAGGGPWRHLWAEGAWRTAGGWADFRDWQRRGHRTEPVSRRAPPPPG